MAKEYVASIIRKLKELYPLVACELLHENAYELLFATRLSAQCTDKRVNEITKILFVRYPTLSSIANCDLKELEQIVRPCGVYKMKAKNIRESANILLSSYGGMVPDTMEELLALPGVGRKTANLILGDIFNQSAIIADTHCIRLSNRLGLCKTKDPVRVEFSLKKIIPSEEQRDFSHRLVRHGRAVCNARSPRCGDCVLSPECAYYKFSSL